LSAYNSKTSSVTPIFCYRIVISMIRCNFLQSLKKFCEGGSEDFAKSYILSCLLQFDNKKWGSPSSLFSYKHSKLRLRVFLAGHIVAMVTYCVTKIIPTCSPVIGQFFGYHDCSIN